MQISANGIAIEIEEHGAPSGEPLLLVMGLGMQLLGWPDGFVEALTSRGFRVIRFDNRDAGLSQRFDEFGVPNLTVGVIRFSLGLRVWSPYGLVDMADDAVGVLDALGIASAHVCGASMGGMIAQHLAVRHPTRVRSLTLMMTSSGSRRLPGPGRKVRSALMSRPADPRDVHSIITHAAGLNRLIGSPGYPEEDTALRARVKAAVERAYRPEGLTRQLMAIAADGDRSPLIGRIDRPTVVIHGKDDPLIPVAAGHDLATKIRGARLDLVDGMGHDLPAALWPRFVDAIASVAGRA